MGGLRIFETQVAWVALGFGIEKGILTNACAWDSVLTDCPEFEALLLNDQKRGEENPKHLADSGPAAPIEI